MGEVSEQPLRSTNGPLIVQPNQTSKGSEVSQAAPKSINGPLIVQPNQTSKGSEVSQAATKPPADRNASMGSLNPEEMARAVKAVWADESEMYWDGTFPRQLGVGLKVENILEVNDATNTYTATIKYSLEWKLSKEEHEAYKKDKWAENNHAPPWTPTVNFPDALVFEMEETLPAMDGYGDYDVYEVKGSWYVIIYQRKRGVWAEVYELQSFPFDCQDLSMAMQSADAAKAVLNPRFKSSNFLSVDMENCSLGTQWNLYPPICWAVVGTGGRSNTARSNLVLQIKLQRKYGYYVRQIMALAGAMSLCTSLAFTMDVDDSNRQMLTFTILLALIAYNLAVSQKLPPVEYFTLLDIYMAGCQIFIFACAVAIGFLMALDASDRTSYIVFVLMLALFFLFQIGFTIKSMMAYKFEMNKLYLAGQDLDDFLDAVDGGEEVTLQYKISSKNRKEHKGFNSWHSSMEDANRVTAAEQVVRNVHEKSAHRGSPFMLHRRASGIS